MTPSAFEHGAPVSRAAEALSGAQHVESETDEREADEELVGASCEPSEARATARALDVRSRRVDVHAGVVGAARTTKAPARAACSGPRQRLGSHPFSHPPGGSAWLRRAPGGPRHRGGSRENAGEAGIS